VLLILGEKLPPVSTTLAVHLELGTLGILIHEKKPEVENLVALSV
jgi:hypothetical protein